MRKLRGKLTYSNVMVTVLAFVVLGGTAYAAGELGKNSVGTKQLKKGAVTQAKIAKSAQSALKGATGPKGAKGDTGAKGDPGPKGSDAAAIMLARVNSVPFEVGSRFGAPSGTSTGNTTASNVTMLTPFTTPVVADGFSVQLTAPTVPGCPSPGACNEIVSLQVNGSDTALICVVPYGGTVCTSGAAKTTIPAGALVSVRASETAPSTGSFDMQVSWHASPAG